MATKKEKDYPGKVDRNVYPEPEWRFPNAKISLTYKNSVADFPAAAYGARGLPKHPARPA